MSWQFQLGLWLLGLFGLGGLAAAAAWFIKSMRGWAREDGINVQKQSQSELDEESALNVAKEIARQRDVALRPAGSAGDTAGWLSGDDPSRREP